MISLNELTQLLQEIEADWVERTTTTSDTNKFCEAICAFANDLPNHKTPGYLLVGVNDKGHRSGLSVTDELLRNLAAIRSDGNIQPMPSLNVAKFEFQDGGVAVVEVLPSDMPPVRYRGRIYVRIGPRKGIASEQDERILLEKRTATARTFDARPCAGSRLDDLALDLFTLTYRPQAIASEIIAENNRDLAQQLASLRFFDLSRGEPTHAGVLLFGKDPLLWLPGAYIQFLRVAGKKLSDEVVDEKTISGDLLAVLRELDSLVEVQVRGHPTPTSALREKSVMDYPVVALRELLMNAVLHRNYDSTAPIRLSWLDDRVEIQSPGGLYGEATPENFPNQNAYRNPVLAEAMKALGYVNKFGRGVLRTQAALKENGNRPAEFHFDHGFFLAVIKRRGTGRGTRRNA